jgi:hypothetical protein
MKKGVVHFSSSFGLVSKRVATAALITIIQFCVGARAMAQVRAAGKDWPKATPKEFAIDAGKLAAFDADLASGKYGPVDSMLILRCGTAVFDKSRNSIRFTAAVICTPCNRYQKRLLPLRSESRE